MFIVLTIIVGVACVFGASVYVTGSRVHVGKIVVFLALTTILISAVVGLARGRVRA